MTEQHPITPSPELVQQWMREFCGSATAPGELTLHIANHAAQWGADTELKSCIAWFDKHIPGYELVADRLRTARRPQPPSLKQQALQELDKVDMLWATEEFGQETLNSLDTIRRALEALPDD